MNDRHEHLSALLDDYRDNAEDRAALSDLQSDVNQQYTLQRYSMIGDVMRNELPSHVQTDFSARMRAVIGAEESLHVEPARAERSANSSKSSFWSSLFKPVAGLAIAASVAVVAVSVVQLRAPDQNGNGSLAANGDLATQARVEQLARTPLSSTATLVSESSVYKVPNSHGTNWKIKRDTPNVQSRLNTYLINHNEHSSSVNGIIPQARIVGFDAQQ